MLYIETPRPNKNRHVHAHKCLHCAGIEPVTSCVVGDYSQHYATSVVLFLVLLILTKYCVTSSIRFNGETT
jgi:hypothetical protein